MTPEEIQTVLHEISDAIGAAIEPPPETGEVKAGAKKHA
jgi:hypothetical protein